MTPLFSSKTMFHLGTTITAIKFMSGKAAERKARRRRRFYFGYEDRGALRGTPGSAYPQPEPNATELPSSAPGRPLRRRTNYLEPQRLRPLRHAPNTSPGCRSCASAPSPAAPAGVREEHYSRNARSARNLGARNRDAAIVRCRCDDALGLPWCCSAHAC